MEANKDINPSEDKRAEEIELLKVVLEQSEVEWVAFFTNPDMRGMVVSGATKEEAFKELMISLAVKLADDNNIFLLPLTPKTNEYKGSVAEAFAELRKLSTGWDNVKCVCDALGRGPCSSNCPEHEDNQRKATETDKDKRIKELEEEVKNLKEEVNEADSDNEHNIKRALEIAKQRDIAYATNKTLQSRIRWLVEICHKYKEGEVKLRNKVIQELEAQITDLQSRIKELEKEGEAKDFTRSVHLQQRNDHLKEGIGKFLKWLEENRPTIAGLGAPVFMLKSLLNDDVFHSEMIAKEPYCRVIINGSEYKTPYRYVEGSYIKELIKAPSHYQIQLEKAGQKDTLLIKDNDRLDLNDPSYDFFHVFNPWSTEG
jgi:DNA repair exonuclease SbcCD ATPase subunit